MTSLSAFVSKNESGMPDAIHIATDGQTYLGSERSAVEIQKVAMLANLPAVIAVRGGAMILPSVVSSIFMNVATFDELIAACPELLKAVCYRYWEVANKSGDKSPKVAGFLIAGFSSERDELECYYVSSIEWDGTPAWNLIPVKSMLITPCEASVVTKLGDIYDEDIRDHPGALAIHVMETQRGHLFERIDGMPAEGGDLVAGKFAQLTTLTRAGISTQILKRWQ